MRLREKEGLSYGVATWAYADAFDDVGGFGGYAIVAPQNLAKAKASLLEEIGKMLDRARSPTKSCKRAKDTWIKDQDTSLSNDDYVAEMLANQLYRGRTTRVHEGAARKIQAVTPADIERVAKKYLDPKRLVIVDAGDHSEGEVVPPPWGNSPAHIRFAVRLCKLCPGRQLAILDPCTRQVRYDPGHDSSVPPRGGRHGCCLSSEQQQHAGCDEQHGGCSEPQRGRKPER